MWWLGGWVVLGVDQGVALLLVVVSCKLCISSNIYLNFLWASCLLPAACCLMGIAEKRCIAYFWRNRIKQFSFPFNQQSNKIYMVIHTYIRL